MYLLRERTPITAILNVISGANAVCEPLSFVDQRLRLVGGINQHGLDLIDSLCADPAPFEFYGTETDLKTVTRVLALEAQVAPLVIRLPEPGADVTLVDFTDVKKLWVGRSEVAEDHVKPALAVVA
jgi:hypothetical protein